MAITKTTQHKPLADKHTGARGPFAVMVTKDLAESANVQKYYTSAQPLSAAWAAGCDTSAGVGETYRHQWLYPVPLPFTQLWVILGGYQLVAGTTIWRLYSDPAILPYTGDFTDSAQCVEIRINSTTHSFSTPVQLPVECFNAARDGMRFTRLILTSENLDETTTSRLWTLHARPDPDS